VKITDDYNAKLKIWAQEARVVAMPSPKGIPTFTCQRFSSGAEMNAWKKELLKKIAKQGGVQWTN